MTMEPKEIAGTSPRSVTRSTPPRPSVSEPSDARNASNFAPLDELGADVKAAALAAFASQSVVDVIALEIAVHDSDVRSMQFTCHRLRGSSLSIGAIALGQACGQLELAAPSGRRTIELLATVRREFDAVIKEIATESTAAS